MKKLAILGSTGSIGTQTLDIVREHPDKFKVTALTCGKNVKLLADQIREFSPSAGCVSDPDDAETLRESFPDIEVVSGRDGLVYVAGQAEYDIIENSLVGMAGLEPTYHAIMSGRTIALANKETLVAGGALIMGEAAKKGVDILPVDSEHCAIFQCLEGRGGNVPKSLLLTASGGPFFGMTADMLDHITVEQALAHPTWKMGRKITIDSATLMNKGFEVIEAARLFGVDADAIRVVVHRESIIHSMVEYADNSIIAQLSVPDMRLCVQYAVNYPERAEAVIPRLMPEALNSLHFSEPDIDSFPLLGMAYDCLREGGAMPAVLNAANEVAVEAFLEHRIGFGDIPRLVHSTLEQLTGHTGARDIDEILHYDSIARQLTNKALT